MAELPDNDGNPPPKAERSRALTPAELAAHYIRQGAAAKPGGAPAPSVAPRRRPARGKRTLILAGVFAAIACGGAVAAAVLWPHRGADSAGRIDAGANPAGKAPPATAPPPKRRFDQAAYGKIAFGMTREQVEGLLGRGTEVAAGKQWTQRAPIDGGQAATEPPPDVPVRMRIVMWEDADNQIWVTFVDGKVFDKNQRPVLTR